ncbi:MAG TPA: hypothetical protein EYP41_07290 [Anaerolineae bacterium]|nr:hypothetical protein [Anaerolineae bacterium]HIP71322.1 hypothetical protein [Anaerolineae bacterium]
MIQWLKRIFGGGKPARPVEVKMDVTAVSSPPPLPEPEAQSGAAEAQLYIEKVQGKIDKLIEDFAEGNINQAQFKELYAHYQREIRSVEGLLEMSDADWQDAATEGQSYVIRRQHAPRARGYAIYDNESGMPISTLGKFEVDPALFVPMLSSYRAATREIFGGGVKATAIEGGRWLCFVPGEMTTMMALFKAEPAPKQLDFLAQLHSHFEKANRVQLANPPVDPAALVFPQEQYLGKWQR